MKVGQLRVGCSTGWPSTPLRHSWAERPQSWSRQRCGFCDMPPWGVDYEFNAHVGIALLCVFVALAIAFVLPFVPDRPKRRKPWKE